MAFALSGMAHASALTVGGTQVSLSENLERHNFIPPVHATMPSGQTKAISRGIATRRQGVRINAIFGTDTLFPFLWLIEWESRLNAKGEKGACAEFLQLIQE
jgi:hypothetical protein